jgi:hypothetical protein
MLREGTRACFTCTFHPPEKLTPSLMKSKFPGRPETLEYQ